MVKVEQCVWLTEAAVVGVTPVVVLAVWAGAASPALDALTLAVKLHNTHTRSTHAEQAVNVYQQHRLDNTHTRSTHTEQAVNVYQQHMLKCQHSSAAAV